MACSASSVATLTILIFGVTARSLLVLAEEPPLTGSGNQTGQLNVTQVKPCIRYEGRVQQFRADLLVIQNDLTHCNVSTAENQTLVRDEIVASQ